MEWDGVSVRAIVPAARLAASHDVEVPNEHDMAASPFPLGLGVCYDGKNTASLPLFYVPVRAAKDRCPSRHPFNPSGVVEGWYVQAKPKTKFSVLVTRVSDNFSNRDDENGLEPDVFVDGVDTRSDQTLLQDFPVGTQHVVEGFCRTRKLDNAGGTQETLRRFQFVETKGNTDQKSSTTEAGTIMLQSAFGKCDAIREPSPFSHRYDVSNSSFIDEVCRQKGGLTLETTRKGERVRHKKSVSYYRMQNRRVEPKAEIKLHVREESWLRSRRIIDMNGQPVTSEMYKKMLMSERTQMEGMRPIKKMGRTKLKRSSTVNNFKAEFKVVKPISKPKKDKVIGDSIPLQKKCETTTKLQNGTEGKKPATDAITMPIIEETEKATPGQFRQTLRERLRGVRPKNNVEQFGETNVVSARKKTISGDYNRIRRIGRRQQVLQGLSSIPPVNFDSVVDTRKPFSRSRKSAAEKNGERDEERKRKREELQKQDPCEAIYSLSDEKPIKRSRNSPTSLTHLW